MPIIDRSHAPARLKGRTDASRPPEFFSSQVSEARRFYLSMAPPRTARLAVVSGGCEHCDPDYRIQRPSFPYHSIEFVARGEGQLTLAGTRHHLVPGSVFAYGPRVAQEITTSPGRPLVKYFVDFTGTAVRALLKSPAPAPGQLVQTATPDAILPIFDELIRAGLRATAFRERLCALLTEQLILRVAETAMPPGPAGMLAFETYQRCRAHLEQHYLGLHSLKEAADDCRVDPAYLCRLFGRYDQQSPYQYLMNLRMSHAAQRLQAPGMLVKQVAGELGFTDAFHFSRAFRRVFGIAPRRFLQLQQSRVAV